MASVLSLPRGPGTSWYVRGAWSPVTSPSSGHLASEFFDRLGPGRRRRPHEAVRAEHSGQTGVRSELAQLPRPRLGADAVLIAVEHEDGDAYLRDDVLEGVVQMDLERVPDPAQPRPLPLGRVLLVEALRLQLVVAAPGQQHPGQAAESRVRRRAGEDERADVRQGLGRRVGGHLGAAGVPDEDDVLGCAGEPLHQGVGELADVQRVRRLAAAGEAGQLDEVRAGPGAELADGRLEVVRHGQAREDDHLGDAVARGADDAAAHDAPGGGAVLECDVGRHGPDGYQAVVGWSTASVSACVRMCVTCWYSGSATMRLKDSRFGYRTSSTASQSWPCSATSGVPPFPA